jgi:hypothetical protein
MAFSKTAFSIMAFGIITFSIMKISETVHSKKTLSIRDPTLSQLSDAQNNETQQSIAFL